ncbi:hypothetical protein ELG83_33500 (plasmid) [Rhizobium leguminosarum]|nr:hypothetical protein ELG88_31810 [Rhizobium leguminosarum]TBF25138.1 hypothetical protein ELG92_30155 [Rhizobium leguminosarum]TBF44943.1 hypothetical protein ELG91_34165 [Rhizobium leguminosarum]TBF45167.1 hypothetical protein ELG90_34745 [Rhizobium leguminosarum]TBF45906.1 hypothetical protein ELG87_31920 [Rhizobium leguminosarum]
MGFELVHNFIGSRIVAYGPGLFPFMENKLSLQSYVTGAELANALINDCSWPVGDSLPNLHTNSGLERDRTGVG